MKQSIADDFNNLHNQCEHFLREKIKDKENGPELMIAVAINLLAKNLAPCQNVVIKDVLKQLIRCIKEWRKAIVLAKKKPVESALHP